MTRIPDRQKRYKQERYKKGRWAELYAAVYLWCRGYKILAWRYKTKLGEIDLVARRGPMLVFIEVKARTGRLAGLDAVTDRSWQRIARAAAQFQRNYAYRAGKTYHWRYDLMVVTPWRLPYHQRDTYRPEAGID
ncbi:MAG TPA: YraN family protein [Alphaproteobacteria bacterium]